MAITIEIHSDARRELDSAAERIALDHPRAAEAFLDAVRRCLEIVREYPLVGRQLRRSQLRQFVIEGWRHSMIYKINGDSISVFAFAHQSRSPGYWRKRVPR